ncbi:MAG TPA: sugar transferase [Clostridiales bacterium]|nr:sugar transferase [Clostridiales bacterium]
MFVYKCFFKPIFDIFISFFALIILALPMLILAIIVKLDSKGPVLFWQDRVTKGKALFKMPKFRTMRTDAPKNQPTHLLDNPEMWITRSGKIYRKLSIDELPQLLSILTQKMSVIGPRPALFNQEDLIAERDKYGANDVLPGLTGWAQVNGRDELEIPVKAKFDGEYVDALNKGGFTALKMDISCLLKTVANVFKSEGVVEGGTHGK